jgi:hypothetical protein
MTVLANGLVGYEDGGRGLYLSCAELCVRISKLAFKAKTMLVWRRRIQGETRKGQAAARGGI